MTSRPGYRSRDLRHKCTERGCLVDALPSWDWFLDAFPRGIVPTDVDGFVEINDNLLFLEEKGAGAQSPMGQRIALKALATRDRTSVVHWRPGARTELEVLMFDPDPSGWETASRAELRAWFASWARDADHGERASQ